MNLGSCAVCGNPITLGRTGPWCAVYGTHDGQFASALLAPRRPTRQQVVAFVYGEQRAGVESRYA